MPHMKKTHSTLGLLSTDTRDEYDVRSEARHGLCNVLCAGHREAGQGEHGCLCSGHTQPQTAWKVASDRK